MAASDPDNENADIDSLVPFSIQPEARRLTIDEVMAENIYPEPGQLDIQWGDRRKYGWEGTQRCGGVQIVGQDEADTKVDLRPCTARVLWANTSHLSGIECNSVRTLAPGVSGTKLYPINRFELSY
jgi:hypothetical protein